MYNFDCQIELNVEKILVFPPKEKRKKNDKSFSLRSHLWSI